MRGKRPLFNLRSTRIRACACDYPGAETWSNFRGWDGARLFFYKMKSFSPFFSNKIPFSSKKYLGGGGGRGDHPSVCHCDYHTVVSIPARGYSR